MNNDIKVLKLNLDELNLAETLELFKIIIETETISNVDLITDKPLPEELLMIVYSNKNISHKNFYLNDKRDSILNELRSTNLDSVHPISSSKLLGLRCPTASSGSMDIADMYYTKVSKICYMLLKAGYYNTLKSIFINNDIIELGLSSSFAPLTYKEITKLFEIISQVPKMNLQIIH